MVEPSILIKPGVRGHLGREIAPYGANSLRKIGRSSLLDHVDADVASSRAIDAGKLFCGLAPARMWSRMIHGHRSCVQVGWLLPPTIPQGATFSDCQGTTLATAPVRAVEPECYLCQAENEIEGAGHPGKRRFSLATEQRAALFGNSYATALRAAWSAPRHRKRQRDRPARTASPRICRLLLARPGPQPRAEKRPPPHHRPD